MQVSSLVQGSKFGNASATPAGGSALALYLTGPPPLLPSGKAQKAGEPLKYRQDDKEVLHFSTRSHRPGQAVPAEAPA